MSDLNETHLADLQGYINEKGLDAYYNIPDWVLANAMLRAANGLERDVRKVRQTSGAAISFRKYEDD